MKSRRFIITEIRERRDNEFLFGCSERVVACSEFQRLLSYMREHGFKVDMIDERSLPKDNNADRLVGYKITMKEIMMQTKYLKKLHDLQYQDDMSAEQLR